jgi:hypothetical protein
VKRKALFLPAALLLLVSSAAGFDGARKGFVLGGGIGISPVSGYSVDVPFFGLGSIDISEQRAGLAIQLIIGYAWDRQNMIIYEGNVTGYSSDLLNRTIGQGYNGAAWYHYFGPEGRSAFSALGLGFYGFSVEDFESNDPGLGLLFGGGYEFSKHWQVGAYLSFGRTTAGGVDFEHGHLSFLMSGVAF